MGNTTLLSRKLAGAWGYAPAVNRKLGGTWGASPMVWQKIAGTWTPIYSVLSASASSVSNTTANGSSSSGTATTGTPGLSVTGNGGALSHSWAYSSGDGSFTCSNAVIANPTFSRAFSGVANGAASGVVSAVWTDTITDTATGATTTQNVSMSAQWTNDIPALGPFVYGCPDNTPTHTGSPGAAASFDQPMTASFVSGGPTSGSLTYAWSLNSWSPFQPSGSVLQNTTLQTCNVHFTTGTHGANQEFIANLSCTVTDTVSGFSSTFSCNASVIFN